MTMFLSYHYTTIEKFHKMLENSVDHDGKITDFKFWASSIYAMNDPKEFLYGLDLLWNDEIHSIEKEIGVNDDSLKLSKMYKRFKSQQNEWAKKIADALYESHRVPFIVSFSRKRDFLPMWTTYANNGNGICLGFDNYEYDIKRLESDIDVDIINYLHATDVSYEKFYDTIKKALIGLYESYYKDYVNKTEGERCDLMIRAYITLSVVAAPYHKHKAYEYEQEDRLILFKNNEADVKYRCNPRGRLIPYIEVPVKAEYLKEIVIGPCSDYESIKRELICMFAKYGISIGKDSIIASEVPYRVY